MKKWQPTWNCATCGTEIACEDCPIAGNHRTNIELLILKNQRAMMETLDLAAEVEMHKQDGINEWGMASSELKDCMRAADAAIKELEGEE